MIEETKDPDSCNCAIPDDSTSTDGTPVSSIHVSRVLVAQCIDVAPIIGRANTESTATPSCNLVLWQQAITAALLSQIETGHRLKALARLLAEIAIRKEAQ